MLASHTYTGRFHGTLGGNILKAVNVEIDPVATIFKVHDQFSCVDRVDWPHRDLTVLPFKLDEENHIVVPATLDGHRMKAILDTGAARSSVSTNVALHDFNLQTTSANVVPGERTFGIGGGSVNSYVARFGSLELGNIQVAAPRISFFPDSKQDSHMPDLVIGMHELHAMHLYIDFSEKKIYITSASGDLAARQAAGEDVMRLRDPAEELALSDIKEDEARALLAGERANARNIIATGVVAIPSPRVAGQRAAMHIMLGAFDDALKDIDSFAIAGLSRATAQVFRGWVAYDEGKYALAREDFESALKDDTPSTAASRDPSALYGRGLARQALGDAGGGEDLVAARAAAKDIDDVMTLTFRPMSDETFAAYARLSKSAPSGKSTTAGN
jgi:hypothetical protein